MTPRDPSSRPPCLPASPDDAQRAVRAALATMAEALTLPAVPSSVPDRDVFLDRLTAAARQLGAILSEPVAASLPGAARQVEDLEVACDALALALAWPPAAQALAGPLPSLGPLLGALSAAWFGEACLPLADPRPRTVSRALAGMRRVLSALRSVTSPPLPFTETLPPIGPAALTLARAGLLAVPITVTTAGPVVASSAVTSLRLAIWAAQATPAAGRAFFAAVAQRAAVVARASGGQDGDRGPDASLAVPAGIPADVLEALGEVWLTAEPDLVRHLAADASLAPWEMDVLGRLASRRRLGDLLDLAPPLVPRTLTGLAQHNPLRGALWVSAMPPAQRAAVPLAALQTLLLASGSLRAPLREALILALAEATDVPDPDAPRDVPRDVSRDSLAGAAPSPDRVVQPGERASARHR